MRIIGICWRWSHIQALHMYDFITRRFIKKEEKPKEAFKQLIAIMVVNPMIKRIVKQIERNYIMGTNERIIDVIDKEATPVMKELEKGFDF